MLANWKTTVAGLVAGLTILAGAAYAPGMSFKQWGIAILAAVATAATGALAKDHDSPQS
jgi:hypothetical protein